MDLYTETFYFKVGYTYICTELEINIKISMIILTKGPIKSVKHTFL